MRKKGSIWLGEEFGKTLMSFLALILLIGLLFSLYFSFRNSEKLEQAKATLDFLDSKISEGETSIEIYNPDGWYISTWASISSPKSCSNLGQEWCICICKEANAESCDDVGVCKNNEKALTTQNFQALQIENPPVTLNINYETRKISLG